MINFFRRIRKRLLSENPPEATLSVRAGSFSKYFLYAIGEILLVMSGILPALQINNWNEARKESFKEIKLLKTIKLDIDENVRRLKQQISSDSLLLEPYRIIVQLLKDDQSIYHDSLRIYFGNLNTYFAFFPQVMAYESLKSEGVNLVKNDSLRFSIIKLFDDDNKQNYHVTEIKKDIAINC